MKYLIILLFLFPAAYYAQFYNGSQQDFGKNRVQYFEFDWRFQNYERFKLYFYRGSDDYAEYVSKTIQKELLEIEARLDFKIQDHLEVLLFKSLTELRQSNVGLTNENQSIYGGRSQIVGSKLLLYYEADHIALNQQVKELLAETILRKLLYGSQWSDIVIGNDINKHPIWFTGGFVDYLAKDWDADFESKIKDGFLTGKFDNFSLLTPEEARLAGHAFWNYVQETFGKSQLMSLLFVTKNVGHIDRSMEYLLGSNLNDMLPEFSNYYKKRFLSDVQWQEEIEGKELDIRMKKTDKLTYFAVDQSGENLAYVLNREGKYKLYVKENQKKRRKIVSYEPKLIRIQDESFPTMTFHPSGKYIAYFIERKGRLFFCLYDYAEKSTLKKEVPNLEKIVSCDYSVDGKSIVISGVKNGQTDLYIYSIPGNSLDQLTDDLWDDLYPKWTLDGKSILFSSNRIDNAPPKKLAIQNLQNNYDLFLFPLKDKDKQRLTFERITETPDVNEKQVLPLKNGNLVYLSDHNGLWNRWELKKDSTIAFIDTLIHYRPDNKMFPTSNYTTGILQHRIVESTNTAYTLLFQNNRYRLVKSELGHSPKEANITYFKDRFSPLMAPVEEEELKETKPIETNEVKDTSSVKIEVFEDGKYEKQKLVLYQSDTEFKNDEATVTDPLQFEKDTPKKYKLNFAKDYVKAKIDNAFLSESYQVYTGPGSVFLNPKISGMLNISLSDVMEDIVIAGGLRIPSAKGSSEFFTGINFRKKRLDKQLFYYRRSYETALAGMLNKNITHEVQLNLVYPFSEVLSLRGSVLSRTDVIHPLAVNEPNLLRKINYNYQAGLKTSLVFDNAKQWSENCWSGSRMKVFAEYLQGVESTSLGMINLGFDARHSTSIRKELIWVNRLAAGTSLGGSRLLYYMGGIDNWLLRPGTAFNKDVPVDPNVNFAYQTLATPMRGFVQNQRNGNSFFVYNSELRIPLFHLFTKGAVKNEPLRSFQLMTFFDLGTAWVGTSPFSKENTFNELVIDNKPAVIKIENSIEPIIAATGFGVRTKIFGYFVRADIGWGIENFTFQKKALVFLSFNHDI